MKQQNYSNYHLWTRSIFSPESVQVIYHSNRCTYSKEFNMKMSNIESQIQIRKVWQSGFHVMLVIKHLWILKKEIGFILGKDDIFTFAAYVCKHHRPVRLTEF